jgi:hypothetical protein
MKDREMETLMNDMEMDELLALEPVPIDTTRVKKLTAHKLQAQRKQSAHARPRSQTQARGRLRSHFRLLVAACVVGTLLIGTAAYAVGSLIVGENPLGFLYQAPDKGFYSADATNEAIPIYGRELTNLDQFNTPVGQTIQSDGVAVTLDSVAIDDNFVEVYLTYRYDEPVDLASVVAPGYTGNPAIAMFTAQPAVTLNEFELRGAPKDSSAYFEDDDPHIIKKAVRYLIPTMLPDELTLTVTLEPFTDTHVLVSAVPEPLNFTVALDKGAAATYTTALEPGTYEFTIEGKLWTLDLKKFAVTPFGAVMVVDNHGNSWADRAAGATDDTTRYLGLRDFALVDQSGTEWRLIAPSSAQQDSIEAGFITGISADVSSLQLAPLNAIVQKGLRSYSVSDIGARLEVDPNNGFWLREYRVEGNTVSFITEPYGDRPLGNEGGNAGYLSANGGGDYLVDFTLNEGDLDPADLGGLVESSYDAATNLYTHTISFYTATEDILRQIESFSVFYDSYPAGEPDHDTSQALTLDLST